MKASSARSAISPVMRELSAYISGALRRPLPADVEESAKQHVLDTIAAMVSGTGFLPGRMAVRYVASLGGVPEATVVGTNVRTSAVFAALANGMPARNGVAAVTLVAAGCTAVDDVFSGERNFFVAYDESRRTGRSPEPDVLVRDLGKTWTIAETNIKRWSVGSPIQAPLDSLFELMRTERFDAADVDTVTVRVYTAGARISDNREMADINMQHLCALMLSDSYVTFKTAHDRKRMRDPALLRLRRRIRLVGDPELEKLRPEKHAIVEVALNDGRRLRHHTRAVRGSAQNPMTRAEVEEKCLHLMAPRLGAGRARALCGAVWDLDRAASVRRLCSMLRSRAR